VLSDVCAAKKTHGELFRRDYCVLPRGNAVCAVVVFRRALKPQKCGPKISSRKIEVRLFDKILKKFSKVLNFFGNVLQTFDLLKNSAIFC